MVIPDIPNQNLAGSQSSACEKTSLESNQSATASARVQKNPFFCFHGQRLESFSWWKLCQQREREERRDRRTSFLLLAVVLEKRNKKNPVTYKKNGRQEG